MRMAIRIILACFIACAFLIGGRRHRVFTNMPLRPMIYHDLTGYSGPQGDRNKPWYLFDAYGYIDPKNGVTTFPAGHRGDLTKGFYEKMYDGYDPHGWVNGGNDSVWFPGRRGTRIVFDMTGAEDMEDTAHAVTLTDIYGYQATFDAGDSVLFYNLNVMFRVPPEERWKYLARPDSMMVQFAAIATTVNPSGAWVSTSVNVTGRYFMAVIKFKNRGAYTTIPDFSEFVLYGDYTYNPPDLTQRPSVGADPIVSNNKTMGQFVGTNEGNGYDTAQQRNEGNIRLYGSTYYWDNNPVGTSLASTLYTADTFPDIKYEQYDFYIRNGINFWWTIKGSRASLGLHTNLNTDVKQGDPESPFNYTFDGRFYYNYAALWGGVAVSSDSTQWRTGARPNGQGKIKFVENGNEDNYSYSQLSYWSRSMGDWDGYESRYGHRFGIHNADPNMILFMSGLTDFDTTAVENYSWFCKIMRTDHMFVWGAVNFHHYPRDTVNAYDFAPGTEAQVGISGAIPETDGRVGIYDFYNKRVMAVHKSIGRGDTTWIINTEYGYSNWGHASTTQNEAAYPWDMGNCPSRPGYDSTRYKALLQERSETIMCFTGVRLYNEFFFHNTNGSSVNSPSLFASDGRVALRGNSPPNTVTYFFPAWYRLAGHRRALWNYRPEAIIAKGDTGTIWVFKWRNVLHPDSVCIEYWRASGAGLITASANIPVGNVNGSINKKSASFVHTYCDSNSVNSTGTLYSAASIKEESTMLFFRELLFSPTRIIYRNKLIIHKP